MDNKTKETITLGTRKVIKAFELLRKYEAWEADLILCDESWEDGLPKMTQEQYDSFLELQAERNELLNQ